MKSESSSHVVSVADVPEGAGGRALAGSMALCSCGWKSAVFDGRAIGAVRTGRRHLQAVRRRLQRNHWATMLHAKVTASARRQFEVTQHLLVESRNRRNLWIVAAARSAEADLRRLKRHLPFHDGRHVWCTYESAEWPCADFVDIANAQGVDVPALS